MARKTMAAARKRRSPSAEQQQQLATMPAAVLETSTAAPASIDPLPAPNIPSPLAVPSYPSPLSHTHDYKRRARGDITHMRKWLHACKHIKEVIEEMGKVLPPVAGSPLEGSPSSTFYGSSCNLHLEAGKFASVQDLISSLTELSTRMGNLWPRVSGKCCFTHCLNATKRFRAYGKQNLVQSESPTSPKDAHMLTLLQSEMIKMALCQSVSEVIERSNLDMGLYGQLPGFCTLKNACLNISETSSHKRKKSCTGDVSKKAANMLPSISKGAACTDQAEYVIKCTETQKFGKWEKFDMDKETPEVFDVWTTHKMSTGELESWIVKHSMPRREYEILLKPKDGETADKLCLESGKEKHIEIEVDLSQGHGFLLEPEAAAIDHMPNIVYVKRIMETISLNRGSLDGHDEFVVLFKALRSDGREIIVDNMYLRAACPLLLATFYEQHVRFLVGKSSGQAQGESC